MPERYEYLEAVERYASDEPFRARVKAVVDLIIESENNTPTEASRVGMWIAAAVALHLRDQEPRPVDGSEIDQPGAFLLSAVCASCGKPLSGDRDFGWWVHMETGTRYCGRTG